MTGGGGAYSRIFLERHGLLADKWAQYLPVHDREIAPFPAAGRPVRLLEIGIAGGGSLAIWEALLPPGSRITGIDIEPPCASLPFGPAVEALILDGTDPRALDAALGDAVFDIIFDIIIDDGSHRSADVVATFGACFRRLAPRGMHVVEDLQASYWRDWGGRYRDPGSSIEFLKSLVDALQADHFVPWDTAIPEGGRARPAAQGAEITRVAFHDSIAVIERGPATRATPHPRFAIGGHSHWRRGRAVRRGPNVRDIGPHRRVLGRGGVTGRSGRARRRDAAEPHGTLARRGARQ
ncbi:class I SAM-dependent methyltransferase [Roseomonas sp. HF4]|uniref:class I SAM-dependent methyltransferase n=1 Tax=Roseomonas sp. HF4 TaxID=2562313 RepID=UPI0010C0D08E|nr:class I SAM-dependent methyltransferase [Roseomonas sp. HF4]